MALSLTLWKLRDWWQEASSVPTGPGLEESLVFNREGKGFLGSLGTWKEDLFLTNPSVSPPPAVVLFKSKAELVQRLGSCVAFNPGEVCCHLPRTEGVIRVIETAADILSKCLPCTRHSAACFGNVSHI